MQITDQVIEVDVPSVDSVFRKFHLKINAIKSIEVSYTFKGSKTKHSIANTCSLRTKLKANTQMRMATGCPAQSSSYRFSMGQQRIPYKKSIAMALIVAIMGVQTEQSLDTGCILRESSRMPPRTFIRRPIWPARNACTAPRC